MCYFHIFIHYLNYCFVYSKYFSIKFRNFRTNNEFEYKWISQQIRIDVEREIYLQIFIRDISMHMYTNMFFVPCIYHIYALSHGSFRQYFNMKEFRTHANIWRTWWYFHSFVFKFSLYSIILQNWNNFFIAQNEIEIYLNLHC